MKADFSFNFRIYMDNTDLGGVMYHTKYGDYFERARSEWLRHHGWNHRTLIDAFQGFFVVRTMTIDFLKPATLDDIVSVTCEMQEKKHASLLLKQNMYRDTILLASAAVKLAFVDSTNFKPKKIHHSLNKKFI